MTYFVVPLVVLLSILAHRPCAGSDQQILRDLMDIYKGPQDSDSENYFKTHGKPLLEQAAMLDAMALAKRGLDKQARDELKYMVVQTLLGDLPEDYRAVGDFMKLIETDRTYVANTLLAGQLYGNTVRYIFEQLVNKYRSSNKNEEAKAHFKGELEFNLKGNPLLEKKRTAMGKIWKADFEKLKRLGEESAPGKNKDLRPWQVYGQVKLLAKRLKFTVPFGPSGKFGGPVADVFGIIVNSFGLAESIAAKDTKGIVKNAIGIVGSLVGLVAFGFVSQGFAMGGPIGAFAGAIFFLIPMIVDLLWPSNLAIETANKLSEVSRNDLNGYLSQLKGVREEGMKSFGWIYQANSGVMIKKFIHPDSIMKFTQPSCASGSPPCAPKKETYEGKPYLVLGQERRSTDGRSQFQLDMPYDFIGVPTEARFCGNTITINTWSFRKYIEKLDFELFKWEVRDKIGYFHRNIEIDTTNVPEYNQVDMAEWVRTKRSSISNKTRGNLGDEAEEIQCDAESDRISIDELEYLDPTTGQVKIQTGAGNDVLSINSMIGKIDGRKTDFIVADLGAGVNMLSLGTTLGVGKEAGELLVGVVFKNTQGQGQICYLWEDFKSQRCVGNVRNVQIFKGSRLSDKIEIGPDGPFTIIQNHGTNLYYFDIGRMKDRARNGKMLRYQIMDYSGNVPQIINYNTQGGVDVVSDDRDKPGVLFFRDNDDNRFARVDIIGSITEPNIYQESGNREYCTGVRYLNEK